MESAVNQEMDPAVKQSLITHSKGWRGINNPWMADGDHDEEFQYINLLVNPERYTGYKVRWQVSRSSGTHTWSCSSMTAGQPANCCALPACLTAAVLPCPGFAFRNTVCCVNDD
jgi:ERO1-like protein alpha